MDWQRQDAQNADDIVDQPCVIPFDQEKQLLDRRAATELDDLVERRTQRRRQPGRIGFGPADFEYPGGPIATATELDQAARRAQLTFFGDENDLSLGKRPLLQG